MFKPHQKLSSYFDRLKSSDENATLIKTNWDLFYLSFLVGLALDRRSSPEKRQSIYRKKNEQKNRKNS